MRWAGRRLLPEAVSVEMVALAEDRLLFWGQLRELAGLAAPEAVRDPTGTAVRRNSTRAGALRVEYEAKMAELKAGYPALIARRMAEGLLKAGAGGRTVAELLDVAERRRGSSPSAWRICPRP